jgi:hypothetical protein
MAQERGTTSTTTINSSVNHLTGSPLTAWITLARL